MIPVLLVQVVAEKRCCPKDGGTQMQITANLIGVRISWRVSDYLGGRETVEQAIKDAGLNPDLLPRNTAKKAVGRASKAVAGSPIGR